jgi:hypothetical protein
MPRFELAHISEQGADLLIVPMEDAIRPKGNTEKNAIRNDLQDHAAAAGSTGVVCLVWDAGDGRMAFLAPRNYAELFRSMDLDFVLENLNEELAW